LALLGILFSQQNQNFIHSINLSGNKSISKKDILYIFRQKPSKIIFNPTIFDSRLLKLDALSLKNFYHSKGFLDVLIRESFTTKDGSVDIFYTIEEGKQYHVSSVDIKGKSSNT